MLALPTVTVVTLWAVPLMPALYTKVLVSKVPPVPAAVAEPADGLVPPTALVTGTAVPVLALVR